MGNVKGGVTDFGLQTIGSNQTTGDNAVAHFILTELDMP
jgi:hypothetical protein